MFKDGRTNVHDEESSGRPSIVSDDLAQSDENICERRRFTVSEASCEFPQISRAVLYEIITLAYAITSFTKMGSENAHGCVENAENDFGFDIFRAIPQIWRGIFQSHHASNR
jgi:hypothetical protein